MTTCALFTTDGAIVVDDYPILNFDNLRELIGGGYIETFRLTPELTLLFDEDGGPKGLPANAMATIVVRFVNPGMLPVGQPLRGNVLAVGKPVPDGWASLPLAAVEVLERMSHTRWPEVDDYVVLEDQTKFNICRVIDGGKSTIQSEIVDSTQTLNSAVDKSQQLAHWGNDNPVRVWRQREDGGFILLP